MNGILEQPAKASNPVGPHRQPKSKMKQLEQKRVLDDSDSFRSTSSTGGKTEDTMTQDHTLVDLPILVLRAAVRLTRQGRQTDLGDPKQAPCIT